jgi:hypothetical protein
MSKNARTLARISCDTLRSCRFAAALTWDSSSSGIEMQIVIMGLL